MSQWIKWNKYIYYTIIVIINILFVVKMKRPHEDDDDKPNKDRRISLHERAEELKFFHSLWLYEQLRFLLAKEGLSDNLVFDVVRSILIDMLYVTQQILG